MAEGEVSRFRIYDIAKAIVSAVVIAYIVYIAKNTSLGTVIY